MAIESLLHFDGTNGSTTFTDATGNHTWTAGAGSPVIDTSQAKFGTSSLHLTSITDSVWGDGTIVFGTGDWTIDFWLMFNGAQGVQTNLFDLIGTSYVIFIANAGAMNYYEVGTKIFGTTTVTTSVWHHIALTRQGNNHYLFLDGTQEGSTWSNASSYGTCPANFPKIGEGASDSPVGWVDELRILIGTAAWTSNFTPPTAAYTISTPAPVGTAMYCT